jgi:hypothetical protein
MPLDVRRVEYYNLTVEEHVAEGSAMLGSIVGAGVDLLAFKAVPLGPARTQFTLFPIDGSKLEDGVAKAGLAADGPHPAVLIRGDEQPGALAGIYGKLAQAGIPIEESCGIAHVNGGFGVVLYLSPEDCDPAISVLG